MKVVAAFDFDGTITRKDTLIEFIKFAKGKYALCFGFLLFSPLLIAYKLRLYPNWKVKQKIFSYYFKSTPLADFDSCCQDFCIAKVDSLLYPAAIKQISIYLSQNIDVVIVSASIDNWVLPFARYMGVNQVLGTKVEVDTLGKLTGRFLTANCFGEEKVNRLKSIFPQRKSYRLIAYGDSSGDRQLLNYADESHYKFFKL